jgi:hypothetical protein
LACLSLRDLAQRDSKSNCALSCSLLPFSFVVPRSGYLRLPACSFDTRLTISFPAKRSSSAKGGWPSWHPLTHVNWRPSVAPAQLLRAPAPCVCLSAQHSDSRQWRTVQRVFGVLYNVRGTRRRAEAQRARASPSPAQETGGTGNISRAKKGRRKEEEKRGAGVSHGLSGGSNVIRCLSVSSAQSAVTP